MTRYFVTVVASNYSERKGIEYYYRTGIAAFEHELPTYEEIRRFCTEMMKLFELKSCAPVMMQRLHDEDKKENS